MKEKELYQKLVDLYAGSELSTELENVLVEASKKDALLAQEMKSLRQTVDALRNTKDAEFTEESHQRILLKLYARGVEMQQRSPDPIHLQYQLPILS